VGDCQINNKTFFRSAGPQYTGGRAFECEGMRELRWRCSYCTVRDMRLVVVILARL
jgi:hypothetical protein